MARKSRKQTTIQAPTVVGAVKSETINTAIYARLSIENSFEKVMALDTDWMQAVKGIGNMDELSADVVKAMVDRVSIFEGKRVQIDLKYQDKVAEVAAIVDALRKEDEIILMPNNVRYIL